LHDSRALSSDNNRGTRALARKIVGVRARYRPRLLRPALTIAPLASARWRT